MEVFNPLSQFAASAGGASRLDTLQGKTICEVWHTGDYRADATFPVIRELLQKRFPELKFVPYTEFPRGKKFPDMHWVPFDEAAEVLRQKGCDAVLLGNGG